MVDAVDNIAFIGSLGKLADNLALREHRTGGADGHILLGHAAETAEILYFHLQDACHDI